MDHERYMNRTIEVAHGNPDAPFGCVVVDRETGEILAEGLNRAEGNPVLHGEISALLDLTDSRAGEDLQPSCSIAQPSCARCAPVRSHGAVYRPSFSEPP